MFGGMTLAAMSLRRMGVRRYSLERARRIRLFTICEWVVWVVSASEPEVTEEASSEDWRSRVGGGEGEGSACYENG